jgi:hypothetical protein
LRSKDRAATTGPHDGAAAVRAVAVAVAVAAAIAGT